MTVKNVFVIGAGVMGNGIAQVSAEAGYNVIMMDIKDEFLQRGLATIEKNLDRKIKKETITEADKTATRDIYNRATSLFTRGNLEEAYIAAIKALELANILKDIGAKRQ